MVEGIIAQRYAKALLNLTPASKDIEDTSQAMKLVAQVYDESEELREFILEPKYNRSQKNAVIKDLINKLESGQLVERFCSFLLAKKRFNLISTVALNYQRLADDKLGRATVHIFPPIAGKRLNLLLKQTPQLLEVSLQPLEALYWTAASGTS